LSLDFDCRDELGDDGAYAGAAGGEGDGGGFVIKNRRKLGLTAFYDGEKTATNDVCGSPG
jgi:hypothetical protein